MLLFFRSIWTLIVGILFIVVGLILVLAQEKIEFWEKLTYGAVTEIGFAFTIAWVVGQSVEISAKREYNHYLQKQEKSLSQNVLRYLFDVDLSKSVFKVVVDHVLSVPIIKTNQKVEIDLLPLTDNDEWLAMRVRFDYRLKNISDSPVQWPIKFHTSRPEGIHHPSIDGEGINHIQVNGIAITLDQITEEPEATGVSSFYFPQTIGAGEEIEVAIEFTQPKRVSDNDLFRTYNTCEALELIIRFDMSCLNVHTALLHPRSDWSNFSNSNGVIRARISEPLLPANGYFIWWNP